MKKILIIKYYKTIAILILAIASFSACCLADDNVLAEGVRPFEKVNLSVLAVTTEPLYPKPGETVYVTINIFNKSSEKNLASQNLISTVNLYANHDLVGTIPVQLITGSGTSVSIPWKAASAGIYSLTAVLDPQRKLIDREPLDNSFSTDVIVANEPPANTDFSVVGVESIKATSKKGIIKRVTVKNDGLTEAQNIVILRSNKRVVASQYLASIDPGKEASIDFILPAALQHDNLIAEINPRFGNRERNAINNLLESSIQQIVDLSVSSLSLNVNQIKEKQKDLTISFQIHNIGTRSIHNPFKVTINLFSENDSELKRTLGQHDFSIDSISAGDFMALSHTFRNIPDKFTVSVKADKNEDIIERNEINNILTSQYKNPTPNVGRWVNIGPYRINFGLGAIGRLYHIVIDPTNSSVIYVGAPSGSSGRPGGTGVWKTVDAGKTWQPITDALPSLAIVGLTLDPTDSSRLYVATPDEGIWRCDNGGSICKRVNDDDLRLHGNIDFLITPNEPKKMFITSNGGVYRSEDGGHDWKMILTGGKGIDLLLDKNNPKMIYATLRSDTNINMTGIYKSLNGGDSWSKPLTGCSTGTLPAISKPTSIYIAKSNNIFYALFADKDEFTVYKTDTSIGCKISNGYSGYLWEEKFTQKHDTRSRSMSRIEADPNDPKYVYGHYVGGHFWKSSDGGKTFKEIYDVHMDHHGFAYDPKNSKIIYTGTDGGIFKSSDRGKPGTWKFIGEGISNSEVYDLANSSSNPNLVVAGTQDNGTIQYEGKQVWKHILGGDGATVAIDPEEEQTIYAMHQWAYDIKRKNKNNDFNCITCGLSNNTCYFTDTHFQIHPTDTAQVFVSCNSLWKSNDPGCNSCTPKDSGCSSCPQHSNGICWRCPSPSKNWNGSASNSWIEVIKPKIGNAVRSAIEPGHEIVYAGTDLGYLYVRIESDPQALVFQHPKGMRRISDIEVDPYLKGVLYVSFEYSESGRIYRFTRSDRGNNIPFFKNIVDMTPAGSGIPKGIVVRTVAVDPMRAYTVYAGTTKSIYRGVSPDKGVTWNWELYSNGMPTAVDVSDLEFQQSTGILRAGTRGRGVYEVNTDHPIGSLVFAEGRITLLRLNPVGTKYGAPPNQLDSEVTVNLDTYPGRAYGFQLRANAQERAARGILNSLRESFSENDIVRIEYIKKGVRVGEILRVIKTSR